MKKILSTLSIVLLAACSNTTKQINVKPKDIEQTYRSTGHREFLLGQLPVWASFSESGRCKHKRSPHYLEVNKVRQQFNLSYRDAIYLQWRFNLDYDKRLEELKVISLSIKEEEKVFFSSIDLVRAKRRPLKFFEYPHIGLIWIDPFLNKDISKIKKAVNSYFENRLPIFISLCLSNKDLLAWVEKNGLNITRPYVIPKEAFSPYSKGSEFSHLQLFVDELFSKKSKLEFFIPKGETVPAEINGRIKAYRY